MQTADFRETFRRPRTSNTQKPGHGGDRAEGSIASENFRSVRSRRRPLMGEDEEPPGEGAAGPRERKRMQELAKVEVTGPSLKTLLDTYERQLIQSALSACRGNQRRAAAALGLLPTTLHEKMKRLGLLRRPGQMEDPTGDDDSPEPQ